MSDEKIFANGLIFKAPREGAPDFVKGSLSIKVQEFIEFIEFLEAFVKPDGWLNIDIKESRGGKLYCELNTYSREAPRETPRTTATRPSPSGIEYPAEEINPDDIPF
jgi:hypothetical protein